MEKRALVTSLLVAPALAVPATIAYAALGHIDWRLVVAIRLQNLTLLRIYGIALTAFGVYDLLHTEREALSRLFGH
jgi:hypothetical protein